MRVRREGYPALAVIVALTAGMLALPASLGNAGYVLIGQVDIGNTESEDDFVLDGWGDNRVVSGSGWGGLIGDLRVVWEPYSGEEGRSATVTFPIPDGFCGSLQDVCMSVLDGQGDDTFEVSIYDAMKGDWVKIYEYVADPITTEYWVDHCISLTENKWITEGGYEYPRGYLVYDSDGFKVKITALGVQWTGHDVYGQLAVDSITVSGNGVVPV